MCDQTAASTQSIADYLAQLLKDRKQLAAFPNVFIHVERLLDEGLFLILRIFPLFTLLTSIRDGLRFVCPQTFGNMGPFRNM